MSLRGKNFTERERCQLMVIMTKYKNIIENKCTNAKSVMEKQEAWANIEREFNSNSEIPRTQKQLHTAYLNMKRSTRKNVADQNVKKYKQLHTQSTAVNFEAGPSQEHTVTVERLSPHNSDELNYMLKELRKNDMADKKGIMATGGGSYNPVLSSVGAQVLAIMGDQVTPLSNSFDSASTYFNNTEDVCEYNIIKTTSSSQEEKPFKTINEHTPHHAHKPNITNTTKKLKRKTSNNEQLKRKYYLGKIACSMLEKKTKLLEYKLTLKRQKLLDIEIKIKEKEYKDLLNRRSSNDLANDYFLE